jgi:hypothetical protein
MRLGLHGHQGDWGPRGHDHQGLNIIIVTKAPCSSRLIGTKEAIRPCRDMSLETIVIHAHEKSTYRVNKAARQHGLKARQEPGQQGHVTRQRPRAAMSIKCQDAKFAHSPWCLGHAMTWITKFAAVAAMA